MEKFKFQRKLLVKISKFKMRIINNKENLKNKINRLLKLLLNRMQTIILINKMITMSIRFTVKYNNNRSILIFKKKKLKKIKKMKTKKKNKRLNVKYLILVNKMKKKNSM